MVIIAKYMCNLTFYQSFLNVARLIQEHETLNRSTLCKCTIIYLYISLLIGIQFAPSFS